LTPGPRATTARVPFERWSTAHAVRRWAVAGQIPSRAPDAGSRAGRDGCGGHVRVAAAGRVVAGRPGSGLGFGASWLGACTPVARSDRCRGVVEPDRWRRRGYGAGVRGESAAGQRRRGAAGGRRRPVGGGDGDPVDRSLGDLHAGCQGATCPDRVARGRSRLCLSFGLCHGLGYCCRVVDLAGREPAQAHRGAGVAGLVAPVWMAAVGWSRVYLGVHWPSDVLGGCCLAITWLALLQLLGFPRDHGSHGVHGVGSFRRWRG
jgi:hypothetical protein